MSQHLYVNQSFNEHQTKKLIENSSESVYIENFLTPSEFIFLTTCLKKIKDWPEVGKTAKYYGFSYADDLGKIIQKWLEPKLYKLIGEHNLDFLAFQEAINPWKIHADIRWYNDKIPYKVILIPLDVEPQSGPVSQDNWPETNTIAFKQHNYMRNLTGDATKTYHGNGDQNWARPFDNPSVEYKIGGYSITKEQWEKYFNHLPYENLEGLSIDKIHKWTPYSAFYWDNTALHCADNFLSNNIKTKRCFMIFTNV